MTNNFFRRQLLKAGGFFFAGAALPSVAVAQSTPATISVFDTFSQRPASGGVHLFSRTGNYHQWTGREWRVLNESVVNVLDYGVIGDGVTDDTIAIQSVIDYQSAKTYANPFTLGRNSSIFFPSGRYRVTSTVNLSSNGVDGKLRPALHIRGDNPNAYFENGSVFVGDTGKTPVLETTGSDAVFLENIGIVSGTTNPSQIGILQARPAVPYGQAFRHKYSNVYIRLQSHLNANGGLGSIGLINISAEEPSYNNLEVWANTPLIISSTYKIKFTNRNINGLGSFNVISGLGNPLVDRESTTMMTFTGSTRLVSWDFISPILLIYSPVDYRGIGGIVFQNLFMQKLLPSSLPNLGIGANSGLGTTATGIYDYAIELWGGSNISIKTQIEGCDQLLLLKGTVLGLDLKASIASNNRGSLDLSGRSYIDLHSEGGNHSIEHSKIYLETGVWGLPFIGWKLAPSQKSNSPLLFHIINSDFKLNKISVPGANHPYSKNHVQKGIFRNTVNSTFGIINKKIEVGENSISTKINKKSVLINGSANKLLGIDLPTVVLGKASFGGICEISGVIVGSVFSNYFISRFSFFVEPNGKTQVSKVTTTVDSPATIKDGVINNLELTLSVANNSIRVYAAPVASNTTKLNVNIIGDIKINYSDSAVDNILIEF
jgi:Pectate lyase superfamily protein